MTKAKVLARLVKACEDAGSATAWAQDNGLSVSYVCDVLKGRRNPGGGLLAALGLVKREEYEEVR